MELLQYENISFLINTSNISNLSLQDLLQTLEDETEDLIEDFRTNKRFVFSFFSSSFLHDNHRLSAFYENFLVCLYSFIIIIGTISNLTLVISAVTHKVFFVATLMELWQCFIFQIKITPRNIFIINLSVSNILLCCFTMPLALLDLITKFWTTNMVNDLFRLMNWISDVQEIMCKLMGFSQATCIFFSSFSILLIATDRHQFIVHPHRKQISSSMVNNN